MAGRRVRLPPLREIAFGALILVALATTLTASAYDLHVATAVSLVLTCVTVAVWSIRVGRKIESWDGIEALAKRTLVGAVGPVYVAIVYRRGSMWVGRIIAASDEAFLRPVHEPIIAASPDLIPYDLNTMIVRLTSYQRGDFRLIIWGGQ